MDEEEEACAIISILGRYTFKKSIENFGYQACKISDVAKGSAQ